MSLNEFAVEWISIEFPFITAVNINSFVGG
jgi:hypothetical protein